MSVLANSTFLVSRTRLGLSDLDLNAGSTHAGRNVVEWGPGRREMTHYSSTSSVSNGNLHRYSIAGVQDGVVRIRVWGTPEDIHGELETLERAFSQLEYTLTIALADESELSAWRCSPADVELGDRGTWDPTLLNAGYQDITFYIPIQPSAYKL